MHFINLMKAMMLALLFIATTNSYASLAPLCPSPLKIHQVAHLINQAEINPRNNERRYLAYTDKTVLYESGLYWLIGAGNIVASSREEAILNAQKIASQVSFMPDKQISSGYCFYFAIDTPDQESPVVLAMGSKDPVPIHASFFASVSSK